MDFHRFRGHYTLDAGGRNDSSLNSAELYDPATGISVTLANTMTTARGGHTATLLADGTVLITGGNNTANLNSAELYDPVTGSFTVLANAMNNERVNHTATLLNDGTVLLTGGDNGLSAYNTSELYDPSTGSFTVQANTMISARTSHTATLLLDGTVLITGGSNNTNLTLASAEIFDPGTGSYNSLPAVKARSITLTSTRRNHTATLLAGGTVLFTGGLDDIIFTDSTERYDAASGVFSPLTSTLKSIRYDHTASLLNNGKVLIAGGHDGSVINDSFELYNPLSDANLFTHSKMTSKRGGQTATLLNDATVLITGGYNNSGRLDTAERYNPVTGSFTALANTMTSARRDHTATLLNNGKVLITGGSSIMSLDTAELYDPSTGVFTALTNRMNSARSNHDSVLLNDGTVLITGGFDEIQWVMEFVLGIRKIRSGMNIKPGKPLPVLLQNASQQDQKHLSDTLHYLKSLARVESVTVLSNEEAPESATALVGDMKVLIPMAGLIDIEEEKARLSKEINKYEKEIASIEAKLGNENFTSRAPEAVVDKERKRLDEVRSALQSLQEQLQRISKI